jgi:hypothetical protein
MHNIHVIPNKTWQLLFRNTYVTAPGPGNGQVLHSINVDGLTRGQPVPKGQTPRDNMRFEAKIKYHFATRGCSSAHVIFQDTDPATPYWYIMSGAELQIFFKGLQAGLIAMHPDGFDVRLTFIKKGTQVFAKPLL